MKRACGILMPVASLPGNYGIGCFSAQATAFIDSLKKAGQSYWQILPLGPTGFGDSPYQSFSSFAGNPYFVDLDELAAEGLIRKEELDKVDWGSDRRYVDYGKVWESREKILREAYGEFLKKEDCEEAVEKDSGDTEKMPVRMNRAQYEKAVADLNPETREYCLYMAVKARENGRPWTEWEDGIRLRKPEALSRAREELAEDIAFYEWVQVYFSRQWKRIRAYAKEAGIGIIGDMPIYVAPDSADAWAHPELFRFDADAKPVCVAGCPPDYFSPDGQFWGNPVYDWEVHKKTGYAWWISRMEYAFSIYDYVRVDHFRGFDEYYAIPAGAENAKNGKWEKGPGMELFHCLEEHFRGRFRTLPIIAEDLGLMTESVMKLVAESGFPAMKVLEFAYDSDSSNPYLPHNYIRNCVAYTGTHDNEPLKAWLNGLNDSVRLHVIRYQGSEHTPGNDLFWDCIRTVLSSIADTAIIPMGDYLGVGEEGRINMPSSSGNNWKWRMKEGEFGENLIWHCNMLADMYGRSRT